MFVVTGDEENEEPKAHTTVTAVVNGSKMHAKTDEDGAAYFEVPDGAEVKVSCGGASEEVSIDSDTADVTLSI